MNLLQSFMIAFSMYSRIPMPEAEWNKENMKYAMCFFPLIGAVIGALLYGAARVLLHLHVSRLFYAVVLTLIPVIVTGGIHMDGFMDTADALGSYGEREKKLAILKDPHTGAFAVLGAVCYLLFNTAVWSNAGEEALVPAALGFILSRALSGYAVAAFKPAKDSGLANTFHNASHKNVVKTVMIFYIAVVFVCLFLYEPAMAVVEAICAGAAFLIHRRNCICVFGGITGDLAGYFLQVCELLILTGVMAAGCFL